MEDGELLDDWLLELVLLCELELVLLCELELLCELTELDELSSSVS